MLRNELLLDEGLHPFESQLRIANGRLLLRHLGVCCGHIGLRLVHGMEVILVVDFDEQLVGLHEIALVYVEFRDVPVHSRKDVDHLIWSDIRRVGKADVQVLLERCDRTDRDDPCFLLIHLGAAAQAKHDKRRDCKKDNDAECD